MIIVPIPSESSGGWVLGMIVGLIVAPLLFPFLDRYVGPILDRYEAWIDRKLSK
jgi:quinol-cytochrome oxidoreductase complex cytochrome b subunit